MKALALAVGLLLALAAPAAAIDFTVSGAVVTATYTEPVQNEDGSALDDLSHTNVYYFISGGPSPDPVKGADVAASSANGGGNISTTVTVPIVAGQQADVTFWATATDLSGNESVKSVEVVKRIDRLAPGSPL